MELLDDALHVIAYGGQPDVQLLGDRLVGEAVRQQPQHLGLARGEVGPGP